MSIATQIRVLRTLRGWSQEDLAKKTGMTQERISLLENRKTKNVSLKTLRRIASVLDVDLRVEFVPQEKK